MDAGTFAFGAGLAGMAGAALSQVGNVGPDLGQNYIVDSFMVVVTGGVGKILGTIVAGFGIGGMNKMLEPAMGAGVRQGGDSGSGDPLPAEKAGGAVRHPYERGLKRDAG